MRNRKKRNIIIGSLCCLLVFMGIGYALLSQTLNINGIANLTGKWKIYIDSITVKEVGGSAKSNQAEVTEDKLTANFDVELLKPGDYVEYDVVVKNEGTINAVLRELIPNIESNNMDILLTHSIIQGQILKAESETKFTLKIRFDERATEIVSGGQTSFDIQMVYEQYDGDAESIDPSLVPVTANDCFTVDENGVITDYDYSCGTYVTIPAVVNGTTVTEINEYAFTEGNVVIYQFSDDEVIYVAKTKEVYDFAYSMFLEEGMTEEQLAQFLFMEGDLNIPDVSDVIPIEMYINPETGEGSTAVSKLEYLDLSQAVGLERVVNGAFATDGSLKYLNLEGASFEIKENSSGVDTGLFGNFELNLNELTIDTDLFNKIYEDLGIINVETLRILKGENSSEITGRIMANETTIRNLIIGEGITAIKSNYTSFGGHEIETVKLPSTLIEIGFGAFSNSNITTIELPENLKTIGHGAFSGNDIKNLKIPASVEIIGESAFGRNENLTNVIFEKNTKLSSIKEYAFSQTGLTSIDFSPIIQKFEIGNEAFYNTNIENVVIDDVILGSRIFSNVKSMELIGDIEFNNIIGSTYSSVANNLTSLKIKSDTLEIIAENAFYFDYTTETTLEFLNESGTETNSSIKTIGNGAFSSAKPVTLVLPTSLEVLGGNAFTMANPTTLVMSPVIKTIRWNAFRDLMIDKITIPSSIEDIGNGAFQSMPSTSTITVNKAEGSFTAASSWYGKAKVIYNG